MMQVDSPLLSQPGFHSYHQHRHQQRHHHHHPHQQQQQQQQHHHQHHQQQHQHGSIVHSSTTSITGSTMSSTSSTSAVSSSSSTTTAGVLRQPRALVQPQHLATTEVAVIAAVAAAAATAGSAPVSACLDTTTPVGSYEDQGLLPSKRLRRQSPPLPPSPPTRALSTLGDSDDDVETIGPFCTEVFLGGSCNPTQWRRDQAIPELKAAQVTYYNPQRADWRPELIELEQQAKENARVLLFVHDKETRSLASMVEVGEMSARKKQLVLAIEEQGRGVMGELLSDRELEEMRRARNYMRDIAEACRIRVHTEIRSAVQGCIDVVRHQVKLNSFDKSAPICDRTVGEEFIKLRSAFDNHATDNALSIDERRLAFRAKTGRELPKDLRLDEHKQIDFDQLCMINAEHRMTTKPNLLRQFSLSLEKSLFASPPEVDEKVFITGPCGEFDWRSTIAFPYFKKQHVPWQQPRDDNAAHLYPMEMQRIERCRVLLFVFTADTWGAPEMIMASYYIGLGKNQVVLCIQEVVEGSTIHGEIVTKTQAKDYNRSRMYLSDQATRTRVPVFASIEEAVAKAADFAKSSRISHP